MENSFKKILIVEDDLSLKPLWSVVFSAVPSQIAWAVSCEEALKLVTKSTKDKSYFDLIISDIFLAGSKTGIELLSSDAVVEANCKTVIISASTKNEIKSITKQLLPNTRVLTKPLDIKKTARLIKHILYGGKDE